MGKEALRQHGSSRDHEHDHDAVIEKDALGWPGKRSITSGLDLDLDFDVGLVSMDGTVRPTGEIDVRVRDALDQRANPDAKSRYAGELAKIGALRDHAFALEFALPKQGDVKLATPAAKQPVKSSAPEVSPVDQRAKLKIPTQPLVPAKLDMWPSQLAELRVAHAQLVAARQHLERQYNAAKPALEPGLMQKLDARLGEAAQRRAQGKDGEAPKGEHDLPPPARKGAKGTPAQMQAEAMRSLRAIEDTARMLDQAIENGSQYLASATPQVEREVGTSGPAGASTAGAPGNGSLGRSGNAAASIPRSNSNNASANARSKNGSGNSSRNGSSGNTSGNGNVNNPYGSIAGNVSTASAGKASVDGAGNASTSKASGNANASGDASIANMSGNVSLNANGLGSMNVSGHASISTANGVRGNASLSNANGHASGDASISNANGNASMSNDGHASGHASIPNAHGASGNAATNGHSAAARHDNVPVDGKPPALKHDDVPIDGKPPADLKHGKPPVDAKRADHDNAPLDARPADGKRSDLVIIDSRVDNRVDGRVDGQGARVDGQVDIDLMWARGTLGVAVKVSDAPDPVQPAGAQPAVAPNQSAVEQSKTLAPDKSKHEQETDAHQTANAKPDPVRQEQQLQGDLRFRADLTAIVAKHPDEARALLQMRDNLVTARPEILGVARDVHRMLPLEAQQLASDVARERQLEPRQVAKQLMKVEGERAPLMPLDRKDLERERLDAKDVPDPKHALPAKAAKPATRSAGGGFAKPKPAPPLPPPPQSANQTVINNYIAKAQKDREAAKAKVGAQQLAKCAGASFDANAVPAAAKLKQDAALAKLKQQADKEKQEAAAKAAEKKQQEGPVTIASLKEKLETTATAEKEELKSTFERKKSELKIKLETKKATLRAETQKQLDNLKTQQKAKEDAAKAAWEREKKTLEKTRDDVIVQVRAAVKTDREKLEADKKKLEDAAEKRKAGLLKQRDLDVAAAKFTGEDNATKIEAKAKKLAEDKRKEGRTKAQEIKNAAAGRAASAKDDDEKKRIEHEASGQANAKIAELDKIADNLDVTAKIDAKKVRADAKTRVQKLEDDCNAAIEKAKTTADGQVKAIDEKVNSLGPLADQKIAKAGADFEKRQKESKEKLDQELKGFADKIAKLKKDGEDKLGKIETEGEKDLQKEYDTAQKAIETRLEVARKQLATGSEKNIKALEKLVDQTCAAIDKSVADAEKKLDARVVVAEKKAQAIVLEQLRKIKVEADKALQAIDKAYADAMKHLDASVAAVHKQIEELAQGKMLELEVHIATLYNDLGDGTRLAAVKQQLKTYIERKQKIPEGYGQTASPAPAAEAKKEGEAKPEDKAKPEEKDPKKKPDPEAEAQAKLLDPDNLSEAGINAKIQQRLREGQKQTSVGADDGAQKAMTEARKATADGMNEFYNGKVADLHKIKDGDPKALAQLAEDADKQRKAEEAGKKAAEELKATTQKKNWYGGKKDPDPTEILKTLEGADEAQIEAMREALKRDGIDLDTFVKQNMSSEAQKKEAGARLAGDPDMGDLLALEGAGGHQLTGNQKLLIAAGMGVGGVLFLVQNGDKNVGADQKRITEILERRKREGKLTPEFIKQFEDVTGRPLSDFMARTGTGDQAKGLGLPEAKVDKRSKEEIQKDSGAEAAKLIKAGDLDGKKIGSAAANLNEAITGFHFDGARADKIRENIKDLSPAELAALKAEYKARTGRDLDRDLEKQLSGAALAETKATLRGDKTTATVNKLIGAEDGGLTPVTLDDKKLQDALKELKDPAERRAVLEAYKKRTGRDLNEVIVEKMTGNDQDLALALMEGDTLKARMIELDEAQHGGFLNGMHKAIAERTGLPTEAFTRGMVNGVFGPIGIAAGAVSAITGENVVIAGYEIGNGSIHKVDSDKIFEILEQTPNSADRERLKQLYFERTGKHLDDDMKHSLTNNNGALGTNDNKYDAYKALMEGRTADYHVARMDDAVWGMNDTKVLHKQLEGKSQWERQQIIAAYEQKHGPGSFLKMCGDQLDGLDKEKMERLATAEDDARTGVVKLPDAFVLKYAQDSIWNKTAKFIDENTKVFDKYPFLYAIPIVGQTAMNAKTASYFMRGWGVDNDAIKDVLKGKSKEEIEALKKQYPGLEADLKYCLSGRDAYEVQLMLEDGEPRTPEEKIKRSLKLYDFDRGAAGAWFPGLGLEKYSNAIVDVFSPSGRQMDADAATMREQLVLLQKGGKLTPEEEAKLARLDLTLGSMSASTTNFIEMRDAVTSAIATAVGVVVGAVVTILTGGVAGAILAALATGLSTVAVKCAMLGQSYGRNEMGVDLAMMAVQMATAGIGGAVAAQSFLGQVLTGAIGNAASSFVQTAITSKDAHDLLGLLAQASKSGLVGFLSGGASAAATYALGKAMEQLSVKAFGKNLFGEGASLGAVFTKGFVTGAGSSVASMFVEAIADPSMLSGNWDQIFITVMRTAVEGGITNAISETAEAYGDKRRAAKQTLRDAVDAAKAVASRGGSLDEQRATFAQVMAKGVEHEAAQTASSAKDPPPTHPDDIEQKLKQTGPRPDGDPDPRPPSGQAIHVDDVKQHMADVAARKGSHPDDPDPHMKASKKTGDSDGPRQDLDHVVKSMIHSDELIDRNTAEAIKNGSVKLISKADLEPMPNGMYREKPDGTPFHWGHKDAAYAVGNKIFIDPDRPAADLRRDLRHEVNHALNDSGGDHDSAGNKNSVSRLEDELRARVAEELKNGQELDPRVVAAVREQIMRDYGFTTAQVAEYDAYVKNRDEAASGYAVEDNKRRKLTAAEIEDRRIAAAQFKDQAAGMLERMHALKSVDGNVINSVRLVPVYAAMSDFESHAIKPSLAEIQAMLHKLDPHDVHALGKDPKFQKWINEDLHLPIGDMERIWNQLDDESPTRPGRTDGKKGGGGNGDGGDADPAPAHTGPMPAVRTPTGPMALHDSGLASPQRTQDFVDRMRHIEAVWQAKAVDQRAQLIADAVNQALREAGVHPVNVAHTGMSPQRNGQLDFRDWQITINTSRLANDLISPAQMAKLVDTAYHEARHAEQWFLVARQVASHPGADLDALSAQTGIPRTTLDAAAAMRGTPMTPSQQAAANNYYQSIYGSRSGYRNDVLDALDPSIPRMAYERSLNDPSASYAEQVAAYNRYQKAVANAPDPTVFPRYLALPEEIDAHAVGRQGGGKFHEASNAVTVCRNVDVGPTTRVVVDANGARIETIAPPAGPAGPDGRSTTLRMGPAPAPSLDAPDPIVNPHAAVAHEARKLMAADPNLTPDAAEHKARTKLVGDIVGEVEQSQYLKGMSNGVEAAKKFVESYFAVGDDIATSKLHDRATPDLLDTFSKTPADALAVLKAVDDIIKNRGLSGTNDRVIGEAAITIAGKAVELGVAALLKDPTAGQAAGKAIDIGKAQLMMTVPDVLDRTGQIVKAVGQGDLRTAFELAKSLGARLVNADSRAEALALAKVMESIGMAFEVAELRRKVEPDLQQESKDTLARLDARDTETGPIEINAAIVPGSEFHGRARTNPEAPRVIADGHATMDSVRAHFAGSVEGFTRVGTSDTYEVTVPGTHGMPTRTFKIRIDAATLQHSQVARSHVNTSKGEHVIQLSSQVAADQIARAIVHEVAEIVVMTKEAAAGRNDREDALRTGVAESDHKLSPHDHGRLAELNFVSSQLASTTDPVQQQRLRAELGALVEHLGLRRGSEGALERRQMIHGELDPRTVRALGELVRSTDHLDPADRHALRDLEDNARRRDHDELAAERRRDAMRGTDPDHLILRSDREHLDPRTGRISRDRAKVMAERAEDARADKSVQTIDKLQQLVAEAHARGEPYPIIRQQVQIGGGAAVSALTTDTLFIDSRGRWQADGSDDIAQTAGQLASIRKSGVGDPDLFAPPNERVPLAAMKFMEDSAASQADVINGKASMKIDHEGRTLLVITPDHGPPITVQIEGTPAIATGFPRERLPGEAIPSHTAVATIKDALAALRSPEAVEALSRIGARTGATGDEAGEIGALLHDPTLVAALKAGRPASDPIVRALETLEGVSKWGDARRSAPGRVLRGDEANLSTFDPNITNTWIIAGIGGTAISTAEIILEKNPNAHVTMIGYKPPPGLVGNTQWDQVMSSFGDGAPVGARRFKVVEGERVGSITMTGGEFTLAGHTAGGYIASLGRNGLVPGPVADLVYSAYTRDPGSVSGKLLEAADGQYLGYRLIVKTPRGDQHFDVTGAASRFLPPELFSSTDIKKVMGARDPAGNNIPSDIQDRDAPGESGNFDGGYGSSANQAAQYRRRIEDGTLAP
jgi:hypothetical protein